MTHGIRTLSLSLVGYVDPVIISLVTLMNRSPRVLVTSAKGPRRSMGIIRKPSERDERERERKRERESRAEQRVSTQ